MTDTKRPGPCANREPGKASHKRECSLPDVAVFRNGLRVKGLKFGPNPPRRDRKRGDIKGWSLCSRKRMRDFMMSHSAPTGWSSYSVTLTIPALPEGHPSPCIDLEGARRLWRFFCDWLQKAGHLAVWRLEIQPRASTRRADIRGIPQPHWHVVGASPGPVDLDTLKAVWLRLLGERGKAPGADKCACDAAYCDGWTERQMRYLMDHASKAKAAQVAEGWGRHWGVIGRCHFVTERPSALLLWGRGRVELQRIMRKMHARRVPDLRAFGGINWGTMEAERTPAGTVLRWLGGWHICRGWWGWPSLPPVADRRAICRAQGVERSNLWAMRKAKNRRGLAGCHFGGAGALRAVSWLRSQGMADWEPF